VPDSGELLLRVNAVGLCGSDLHWFLEGGIGDATLTRPLVLGHELAGMVASGPRTGERVAVDPAIPDGRCAMCLAGDRNLCVNVQFAGHSGTDGALRELLAWPEDLVCPLPDSLSDAEGALLEPLGVALHALDLSGVTPGMTAAVCGCGPIGLLVVQLLHLTGATTILATDLLPHRIAAAEVMGATDALRVEAAVGGIDLAGRIPGAYGADVAFDAAGDDSALEQALNAVRPGGRVVMIGIPPGDRTSFKASTARRKGLTMVLCRRMKHGDLRRAVQLAASGRMVLGPLITERHSLEDGQEAFAALATRRGLKVVIEP
jgi:L-iditol 2-dehydrogenase